MSWALVICENCKIQNRVRHYDPLASRALCGRCKHRIDEYDRQMFARKFRRVYDEIDYLEEKIKQTHDFWGFTWHRYTIDELMKSEHHRKIDSITDKIGDDVQNWYDRKTLTIIGKEIYERNKDKIEERLKIVNMKILRRKPTYTDKIKNPLKLFVQKVIENLFLIIRNKSLSGAGGQKSLKS